MAKVTKAVTYIKFCCFDHVYERHVQTHHAEEVADTDEHKHRVFEQRHVHH